MRKYNNPEMKVIAFIAEEAISADPSGNLTDLGSKIYNDAPWDGLLGGQANA